MEEIGSSGLLFVHGSTRTCVVNGLIVGAVISHRIYFREGFYGCENIPKVGWDSPTEFY